MILKTKKTIFFLLILISINGELFAQNNIDEKKYFVLPGQLAKGQYIHVVSLSMAKLPEDFVEEASDFFKAPLFGYSAVYGLPKNFGLDANLRTNIITWQFSLGAKWNYTINRFSFAVGYDLAFMLGQLKKFGFDSRVNAWISYPNLTIGYELNDVALSLKGEAMIITFYKEYADDIEVGRDKNLYSGFALSAVVEQPFWKNTYFTLSLKLNYVKFYYPTWAAYSRFDRYYWIPELVMGFVL
jgi:hypothetical protein